MKSRLISLLLVAGVLAGCKPPAPAPEPPKPEPAPAVVVDDRDWMLEYPPLPDDVIRRVINGEDSGPAPEPPKPDPEPAPKPEGLGIPGWLEPLSSTFAEAFTLAAADPPKAPAAAPAAKHAETLFVTATWCVNCPPWKRQMVDHIAKGKAIRILDFDADADELKAYRVDVVPCWIRLDAAGKVVERLPEVGAKGFNAQDVARLISRTPARPAAVAAGPPPVQAITGPTLRVFSMLESAIGKTFRLADKVRIEIPPGLTWTVKDHGNGIRIEFSQPPTVVVSKFIDWRLRLKAVRITVRMATLELALWPDLSVPIDWSGPAAEPVPESLGEAPIAAVAKP